MTGGIASRHVKGQSADDPPAEPANSNPPGLATTMRMAARPSSCLQRKHAAPFDLSAESSICGWDQALELLPFNGAPGSVVVGPRSCSSLRAKAATVRLTRPLSTFTRSVLRIRAPNGRPFATSPSRSSRVRFSDFLARAVPAKSTTQNVLIRLLDGYEGNVAVLGKDLRAWDRGYYRRIGVADSTSGGGTSRGWGSTSHRTIRW